MNHPTLLETGGAVPRAVLRTATRDEGGRLVCPECVAPIDDSRGTVQVPIDALESRELRARIDAIRLPSHGRECDHGNYVVVCPRLVGGPYATGMKGWRGVAARFADETVRHIPIPERELVEHGGIELLEGGEDA